MALRLQVEGGPSVRCTGFTHEVHTELTRTPGRADPRTPGRSRHEPVVVTRPVDRLSPRLAHAAAAGVRLGEVVLHVTRLDEQGEERPWYRLILSRVLVVRVVVSGEDDLPLETLTLDYGAIAWAFDGDDVPAVATWAVHPDDDGGSP